MENENSINSDPNMSEQIAYDDIQEKYCDILFEMTTKKDEIIENEYKNLDSFLEKSEKLFKRVKMPQEMKLDARVMNVSTKISSATLEKDYRSNNITTSGFIKLYSEHLESENNEFLNFLKKTHKNYLGITFYNYPVLSSETAQNKLRTRATQNYFDNSVPLKPAISTLVDEDEGTLRYIKNVKQILKKHKKISFFELIIDPNSFSKTVENIFYMSFAIKLGAVGLKNYKNDLYIESEISTSLNSLDHFIFDISYDEYLKIVENMKDKSMIKNFTE
ncbi:hypothetical protein CWI39_0020p0020 [Hamiltosporidium magnivora]|uniref:Non-structural maintenance of chromosomes element 4 n=1 Tax=Hamiltosporidium magnivora TaxID=148818 RepID=A0A4V2JX00_9MICR|nr:hypothetical protein CWI39_0020p0020 [Hamiltosporidium magnivora]